MIKVGKTYPMKVRRYYFGNEFSTFLCFPITRCTRFRRYTEIRNRTPTAEFGFFHICGRP